MNNRIIHRGPDAEGIYVDDYVALGQRRLSIIDIKGGDQPIYNEDKSVLIVYNGEVYNYKELKEELKEYKFTTNTDTEVILHGYEKWGHELLNKLRGMFAFAIYDKNKDEVFIARDQFGIKPLYYYKNNDVILFGSEIKSFLAHPKFIKELNRELLGPYLTFSFTPTDETFFRNVYRLPGGNYMTINVKNGDIKINRYFKVSFSSSKDSFDEMVDKISNVMEDSTKHHLISDVEVGSFLSSGVDSSYLVSLARPDKTYTIGFDLAKYSEIDYAKDLTDKLKIKNISEKISKEEYMKAIPDVYYHMDEPTADGCAIAVYFLSRLASRDVKVVLSGEGADELFGGYNIYHEPISLCKYQKIPRFLRRALATVVEAIPANFKGKNFIIRGSKDLPERFIGNAFMFSQKDKKKLLKDTNLATAPQKVCEKFYEKTKNFDDITRMQYLDVNLWMVGDILLKADRMSMANALELRVPFLDKEVFKVARTIPSRLKVNNENTKVALRSAALKHLPKFTAEKKKLGFPVPIRVWLREEPFYNIVKNMFTSDIANEFFNTNVLLDYLDRHFAGKEDNSRKIWTIYIFLVWYNVYFCN